MPAFNVLTAVTEVVEAPDAEVASATLNNRLRAAGFSPYEGTADLVPDGYQLAFEIEEDR